MNQKKVVSSLAIRFFERFAAKAIGLVISILLARLLEPDVFGLLALIMVFVNLANTFVQSGFGTALVQNKTTKEDDYSTVFFVQLTIAAFFTALIFFAAPAIAQYYGKDELMWPLRVLSFTVLFSAFNSIQVAKLQREMRFKQMMYCNLISTVISGTIGVISAYRGAGLWALVIYNSSYTVMSSMIMLFIAKWHPRLVFSLGRARVFFSFGWKILISGLLCSLYYDIRAIIIGRRYSTVDLAYYNKGQQYPELIERTIDEVIQSVMLPVMSQAQDSKEELEKILLRAVSISAFGVVPAMFGLAAVAKTMIPMLLTEKWMACIPFLTVFCLGSLAGPFQAPNLILIKAMGRSDIYMKVEVIRRIILVSILLLTVLVFDSPMAIAAGFSVGFWLDTSIAVLAVKKLTGVSCLKQVLQTWKSFVAGAIMFAAVYPMNLLGIHSLARLILQIAVGVLVYFLVLLILKNEILVMGKDMVFGFLKNKNQGTEN